MSCKEVLWCVHNRNKDGVIEILQNNEIPIKTINEAYRIAARLGLADLAKLLQSKTSNWKDPLSLAVENGHVEFVQSVYRNLEERHRAPALCLAIYDAARFGHPFLLLSILGLGLGLYSSIPRTTFRDAFEEAERKRDDYADIISMLRTVMSRSDAKC